MGDDGPEPADFSCSPAQPTPGEMTMVSWPAVAFAENDGMGGPKLVPGLEVQVFFDNVVPVDAGCGAGCTLAVDNGDGTYDFEAPADGWFAYRVMEQGAQLRTMEVNTTPAPDQWFNTVAAPVLDGLFGILQLQRDPAAMLVAGRLVDCSGRGVRGAVARVFSLAGDEHVVPTVYFNDAGVLPDPTRDTTNWDGRFSLANVPVSASQVAVKLLDGDTALGCELAAAASDTLSTMRVGPMRSDAPSACE